MSESIATARLRNPTQAWQSIIQVWKVIKGWLIGNGGELELVVRKATRSTEQNRLMWSCLSDLSDQVTWFGKRLTKEGWKDFITGHLDGQDLVPNMDGTGFISIGKSRSTSRMTKAEMTAVIDLAHAFGADKGVQWSPTSLGINGVDCCE